MNESYDFSTIVTQFICEPLAQLVEHLTFNQRVAGSNPAWLTILVWFRGRGGMADALA